MMLKLFLVAAIFLLLAGIIKIAGNSIWDGNRRFTAVVDTNPMLVFSIEPVSQSATVVSVPTDTMLDVPYGYGSYPAGSVYKLGSLDQLRLGGKLLSRTIENTFFVAVDGFLSFGNHKKLMPAFTSDGISQLKKSYFSIPGFLPSLYFIFASSRGLDTNLSFIDLTRIWLAFRNLRRDQIKLIILSDENALASQKQPDQTNIKVIKKDALDHLVSTNFQDRELRMENISLEIVNATGINNLASLVGKTLENLGANVVSKSTAEKKETESCRILVYRKDLLSSIIIDRLKRFYSCEISQDEGKSVADVKMIIGEDFTKIK